MTKKTSTWGAIEILLADQAPGDDEECGQGNAKDHSQNSPERRSPKENRNHHHDGMQSGLLAHDLGRKVIAFDQLNHGKGKTASDE
ncbi:MAG: hypothetical protein CMI33_02480 [Opitutales bacterium]|nr:hypothetical protein [Opitutales bacterium]